MNPEAGEPLAGIYRRPLESGPRAHGMAGAGPEEVDLAMLYDAFTRDTVLFSGGSGLLLYDHPGRYGLF